MSGRPSRIERQAYKWLLKMLEDPGRHALALERWLSKDPERRAIYKRVAVEVGRASDSAARVPSLRLAISPAPERVPWGAKGRLVAAGGLIIVGAVVVGTLGGPHLTWRDLNPGRRDVTESRTYVAATTDRIVRLEDSSEVTLFADSRIATHFTNGERSVDLLRGGARFAVSHNPAQPFVVYAAGGKVTATGTLFEVAIVHGVNVRLLSGSVEVSLPRTAKEQVKKVVHLSPGEQVSYSVPSEADPQPTAQIPAPSTTRAVESFDDVPAAQIVEKVNQRSAIKIVFADATFGRREIFADLNITDVDAVAQKLAALLGLIIDRSKPGRLLLKNPD